MTGNNCHVCGKLAELYTAPSGDLVCYRCNEGAKIVNLCRLLGASMGFTSEQLVRTLFEGVEMFRVAKETGIDLETTRCKVVEMFQKRREE